MASTAVVLPGEGTLLAVGSVGTVEARVSISGPDLAVASVEKTTLDSSFKEFRPSNLPDPGTLDFKIYFNPASGTHAAMLAMMAPSVSGSNVVTWTLTFANGAGISAQGFITAYKISGMEVDSNVSADVSVKLTGPLGS